MKSLFPIAALAAIVLAEGPVALRAESAPAAKAAPEQAPAPGIAPSATSQPTPPPAAAPAPVSSKAIEAKIVYCKSCHGSQGQGYLGYSAIPRLAGQQVEYFEKQINAFNERRRQNPIMFNVAHDLSPQMLQALASYFHDLNPKPYGTSAPGLVEEGRNIYQNGAPDIPPCTSCHGNEAHGDGQFPRLAGQLPEYTIRTLGNWSKERGQDPAHPDSSAIMEPIAHGLKPDQVKAIAAYVSTLQ